MLTIEQVKVFTLSPAVVRLIAEIKTARLKEARVKAHVAGYIEPALSAFEPFRRSLSPRDPRNGERITSTKDPAASRTSNAPGGMRTATSSMRSTAMSGSRRGSAPPWSRRCPGSTPRIDSCAC